MRPMAKRLVIRALTVHGCLRLSDEGKHEKWRCPERCGRHTTAVPRHAEITAGVLRGIITDLKCLPKGWLQ
jgi:predicted RNA binding protein YcfA (HicA-like mRNA interferase family)